MSREDVRLEGYEPGGGFQPARLGIDFKTLLALVAYFAITSLLGSYLGNQGSLAVVGAASGAALLAIGMREILNPGRREEGKTQRGARRLRIEGLVMVVVGTALAISCILSLWAGNAVALLWLGPAYLAMVLVALALWTIPVVRQLRPDGEGWISPRRRLAGTALLALIAGILCFSSYLEHTGGYRSGRPELALPAVMILFGLFFVSMPRAEDAAIDMRPGWAIASVLLAPFFYFMFSV